MWKSLALSHHTGMREDTVKSHQKLVDCGHVIAEKDLPVEYWEAMQEVPGEGYFIPWRTVYNEGSISTPCRIVFDASSKTPGGESLNGILAKGQNRLAKLQHLLVKFRSRAEAVTGDISMVYNGTMLVPAHSKFQKDLWKEGLLPESPTVIMLVSTKNVLDIEFAGYPAILKAGNRISGRISGYNRIPDIRLDIRLN